MRKFSTAFMAVLVAVPTIMLVGNDRIREHHEARLVTLVIFLVTFVVFIGFMLAEKNGLHQQIAKHRPGAITDLVAKHRYRVLHAEDVAEVGWILHLQDKEVHRSGEFAVYLIPIGNVDEGVIEDGDIVEINERQNVRTLRVVF